MSVSCVPGSRDCIPGCDSAARWASVGANTGANSLRPTQPNARCLTYVFAAAAAFESSPRREPWERSRMSDESPRRRALWPACRTRAAGVARIATAVPINRPLARALRVVVVANPTARAVGYLQTPLARLRAATQKHESTSNCAARTKRDRPTLPFRAFCLSCFRDPPRTPRPIPRAPRSRFALAVHLVNARRG